MSFRVGNKVIIVNYSVNNGTGSHLNSIRDLATRGGLIDPSFYTRLLNYVDDKIVFEIEAIKSDGYIKLKNNRDWSFHENDLILAKRRTLVQKIL